MKARWLVLVCVFFLIAIGTSYAQPSTPLMLVIQGQLYRLEGEALVPYTECQPPETIIYAPIVSPDNNTFALRTIPTSGDEFAINLWLCNHETHTLIPITSVATNSAKPTILRNQPVFARNGEFLFWSEVSLDVSGNFIRHKLGKFLVTEGKLPTYFDLPEVLEQATPSPLEVWVSTEGIHLYGVELRDEAIVEVVYNYDFAGNYLGAIDVLTIQDPSWFTINHWQNGDKPELIVLTSEGWYLLDLITGEQSSIEQPQLIRRPIGIENTANTLVYTFDDGLLTATPLEETTGTPLLLALPETSIAQSPDGETIAYADTELRLWERGAEIVIPNTVFGDAGQPYLAWGAFEYAVESSIETTFKTCDGIISSPFVVGDVVQLISPTANNLRETPSRTGNLIGQLKPDETASILAGPVCADGFAWFQVDAPAAIGWTVYGNTDETYFAISS